MDASLKQRLVGASVIIALAVIFIPMIFDNSNKNLNQSISIEIPKEPNDLQQRVISIDKTSKPTKTSVEEIIAKTPTDLIPVIEKHETIIDIVDNTKAIEKIEEVVVEEQAKPIKQTSKIIVSEQKPKEVKSTKPQSTAKPITKPIVQIADDSIYRLKYGVFSQQKNAQQLKAKIIHNGLDAIVEKDAATGMYKVYSKQYVRKASVERIQTQVKSLKLNIGTTSIEQLNQQTVEEVEKLLDTGWIVQIGIFSSRENSVKLRDKIRKKGFVSFVDEIMSNKNQKLYRVRIGPYAERAEAESTKAQIKKKMNLEGLIKPHEKQKVVS